MARSDLAGEYRRAAQACDLTCEKVRMLNRNALQYSILPGQPLFVTTSPVVVVTECRNDRPDARELSPHAAATWRPAQRPQWEPERRLNEFDRMKWVMP